MNYDLLIYLIIALKLKAKAILGEANTLVGDLFKTVGTWLTYLLQVKY